MKTIRFFRTLIAVVIVAMTTACGATDKVLDATIDEINKQLEGQKIPGIEKMYMSADDNYVIYNYIVDEDAVDFDAMKQTADQQKEQCLNQIIRNPEQEKFLKVVKLADRGIKFLYKGNKTDTYYDFVFEKDEL